MFSVEIKTERGWGSFFDGTKEEAIKIFDKLTGKVLVRLVAITGHGKYVVK